MSFMYGQPNSDKGGRNVTHDIFKNAGADSHRSLMSGVTLTRADIAPHRALSPNSDNTKRAHDAVGLRNEKFGNSADTTAQHFERPGSGMGINFCKY
jgi:hypothetical protein